MRRMLSRVVCGGLLLVPAAASGVGAQDVEARHSRDAGLDVSLEFLRPTKGNRPIDTFSADVGVLRTVHPASGLSLGVALTATHAHGHIIQLTETLQSVRYETSAFGIGPVVRARWQPIRVGDVALGADISAGLLLYSERFPAGGDHYNGMLRIGPVVSAQVSPRDQVTIAAKWMHVSNGQGLGAHNPSYEAAAITMGLRHLLTRESAPSATTRKRAILGGAIGGAVGLATGLTISRHCTARSCRVGPGIGAVGALTGAGVGVTIPLLIGS